MLVTGVQAVGAKGVTAIQGAVVDVKAATRTGIDSPADKETTGPAAKPGEPQPVVFPRAGIPMDNRPASLREHRAAQRYRRDGGTSGSNGDAA